MTGGFFGFAIRRIIAAIPTLFGVTLIVFFMVRVLPGDPARLLAGLNATQDEVDRIRVQLGLTKPVAVQYELFLRAISHGNLGKSITTQAPVVQEISSRLPKTALLAATATVLSGILGIVSGIAVSTRQYTSVDYLVSVVAFAGVSIPVFWLGLMLMIVFAVFLHLVPAGGAAGPTSLILPSITLAAFSIAFIERQTRSSMLETLRQDYVRTARAKGLVEGVVVFRHALRNALIPVVTVIGLQFGALFGGAILTETTFAWPGIGQLLVTAISARDYPIIQGVVLLFAITFLVVNLVVDLLYGYIDPRIKFS
ncbi:MAG TPA: ABC transporter permease [bacterium]|nr:ABC transporter permease [bacterium]